MSGLIGPGFIGYLGGTVPFVRRDPYFASTVLLAGFNGVDAATTTSDESEAAHGAAAQFGGTAQLDTAEKKFGSASLLLDGNSDFVDWADHADWAPGEDEAYTWEAFVHPTASAAAMRIMGQYNTTGNQRSWLIDRDANDFLQFTYSLNGTSFATIQGAIEIAQDEWTHVAVTRTAAGAIRLFVGGVLEADSDVGVTGAFHDSTDPLRIGVQTGGTAWWPGWLDEIRLTKGVARYTATFAPPVAAFARS